MSRPHPQRYLHVGETVFGKRGLQLAAELLRKIALREGMGSVLAEGGRRAAEILGMGQELADELYAAWGFAGHWDGRGDHANHIVFPYWLVTALQWAMDTRDPISSGHGYGQNLMRWGPFSSQKEALPWEQIKAIGKEVYGTEKTVDPESGYDEKAIPAVWHGHRSVLKDSLPVDDQIFPRIFSRHTEDGYARADGMEGPAFEYHLFVSATGMDLTEKELDEACERVFNIERALLVRNYGRAREDDETVIPYFEQVENWENPILGARERVHREKFLRLMDEYYRLREWDLKTGRPTRGKLEKLGLREVADELERRHLLPAATFHEHTE